MWLSCAVLRVCRSMGVTYCDDIQNAEEAVNTVSRINLLHHIFFAILEDMSRQVMIKDFTDNPSCKTNTQIKAPLNSMYLQSSATP